MVNLLLTGSQLEFGELVGISQQAVSDLSARGVLSVGAPLGKWLIEYCSHLREMAAGRATDGTIDLPTERALLARAQREGQEIKNEVARGMYAPIDLLTDVLASASQAVVDRLDQIPAGVAKVCPDLPHAVRDLVMTTIADARNEMVRKTLSLVADRLDPGDMQDEDEPPLVVDDENAPWLDTTKEDEHG